MNTPLILKSIEQDYKYLFSICTLVNDFQEYKLMKSSFENCGFTDNCEYLLYDNSKANTVDAYQAISGFLKHAQGKYIIAVHQDVRCLDTMQQLLSCIDTLSKKDQSWAICGNAGCNDYHEQVRYLDNAGKIMKDENLPRKVKSLDENLLIINRASNISISGDLKGYHFYGTDLCIIADFLGYTSYVIPFMVKHLSLGGSENFRESTKMFKKRYSKKLRNRYIETTCTRFYLSNGRVKTQVYNTPPFFSLIKATLIFKKVAKYARLRKKED